MIRTRGLLLAMAGAGLMLQGCSSSPPPPPAPVVQALPPTPDYSGTYSGKVTYAKGCHGPSTAILTVQNQSFTLPWSKAVVFSGPVGNDGSVAANIAGTEPSMARRHKRVGGTPGADVAGSIAGDTFNGQAHSGKCTTPLSLKKTS